jgi:hypothetical protein
MSETDQGQASAARGNTSASGGRQGEGESRVVPEPPAFIPSGWPSSKVPPTAPAGPATFSFGEPPADPGSGAPPEEAVAAPGSPPAEAGSLAITTTGPDPQALEIELAAARDEIRALHEMLEDLPEIFERKFQQRLATILEHQKHLLADNQALRDRLYGHGSSDADGPGSGPPRSQPALLSTVASKPGWGQALKRALRLGGPQKISRHDDGRPITA